MNTTYLVRATTAKGEGLSLNGRTYDKPFTVELPSATATMAFINDPPKSGWFYSDAGTWSRRGIKTLVVHTVINGKTHPVPDTYTVA
jgi:hypothetical protein